MIERALLLAGDETLSAEALGLGVATPRREVAATSSSSNLRDEREAAERRAVMDALDKTGGNQTKAAALLGVSRRTLVTRLQLYGLTKPRKKE